MGEGDSRTGSAAFPNTAWSIILGAQDPGAPAYRDNLGRLIAAYWKPVFAWLRAVRGVAEEEARDLTQEFFTLAIEREMASAVSPDKGRFRTFLKIALRNFLSDRWRYATAQKRGGGAHEIRFDELRDGDRAWEPVAPEPTPQAAFDALWKQSLLDQAWGDVADQLAKAGKSLYADIFRRIVLDARPDQAPTYRDAAVEFGVDEVEIANRLAYVKHLLRIAIRRRIQEYVSSPGDVEQELSELFGGAP